MRTCNRYVRLLLSIFLLLAAPLAAASCTGPGQLSEAKPAEVRAFFSAKGLRVVTFLGYSGAEYEDPSAMLDHAGRILDRLDPKRTVINVGATAQGIGAVYELARQRGFTTSGIVSTRARDGSVPLSPCVDYVFFIADSTWGGFLPGGRRLSPTSEAMVGSSRRLVAIGGGDIARDELLAARRAGKQVTFIPADMNHRVAIERAAKRGQPPPTDFRGSAFEAFGTGR